MSRFQKRSDIIVAWSPPRISDEALEEIYELVGNPMNADEIRGKLASEMEQAEMQAEEQGKDFFVSRCSAGVALKALKNSYNQDLVALSNVVFNNLKKYGEQVVTLDSEG